MLIEKIILSLRYTILVRNITNKQTINVKTRNGRSMVKVIFIVLVIYLSQQPSKIIKDFNIYCLMNEISTRMLTYIKKRSSTKQNIRHIQTLTNTEKQPF